MKAEEIIEENVCFCASDSTVVVAGRSANVRFFFFLHKLEDMACHLRRGERWIDRERDRELDERCRLRLRFDFLECFFRGVGDREEDDIDREHFL